MARPLMGSRKRVTTVTREAIDALQQVHEARPLARLLRNAKSNHPWTNEECSLLARLCQVLRVDEGQP